jgi:hypothetical protein
MKRNTIISPQSVRVDFTKEGPFYTEMKKENRTNTDGIILNKYQEVWEEQVLWSSAALEMDKGLVFKGLLPYRCQEVIKKLK